MDDLPETRVVGAAMIQNQRCLIARRGAHVSNPGCWEFPGGKVEAEEAPEEALKREIEEELDLEIRVHALLGRGSAEIKGRRIVLEVYTAEILRREPRLSDHDEICWVGADDLGSFRWAEADIPILPALRKLLLQDDSE